MHKDISRQTSVARQQQLAQSKPSRSGGRVNFQNNNSSAQVFLITQKHFR